MNSLDPGFSPFALPDAGFDYFNTQVHCRSLASRILTILGGFSVVVVTGDQWSSGRTLSTALEEGAAGRYQVIAFPWPAEPHRDRLLHFRCALSSSSANESTTPGDPGVQAVVVFDDVERIFDAEIEEIFRQVHHHTRIGEHRIAAAVLLARAEFLTRLEHPALRAWLARRLLVARVRFDELGPDEISAFIHHQLPWRVAETIFTDQAVAAIASVSGGDPRVVNRFSRRILERATGSIGKEKANFGPVTSTSPDVRPEKGRATAAAKDGLWQNYAQPEHDRFQSARTWRDRRVARAGTPFLIAGAVAAAAVVYPHPISENVIDPRTAPAIAKLSDHARLTDWSASVRSAEYKDKLAVAIVRQITIAAMTAPAAPTRKENLAIKTPILPQFVARSRPNIEFATPMQAAKTVVNPAIPLPVPTEFSPIAAAVSPTGMQKTRSTPSTPDRQRRLPAGELAGLLARGDELLALGDVSSARLFYERAAGAGDGRGALRLGETFDPIFLGFAHFLVRGDSATAEFWYQKARELGNADAETRLKRLEPLTSKQLNN